MAPHSLPRWITFEGADAKFTLVADDKAFGHAQPICKNAGSIADVLFRDFEAHVRRRPTPGDRSGAD